VPVEPATVKRIHYGSHRDQFADLRRPEGTPIGTLVLLHGGYWKPGYHLDQLDSIANLMTRAGWLTCNVEYRPVGDGFGFPDPMTDVALAVDRLEQEDLASGVVLLGHSAGGQLAVWAASRTEGTPGGAPRVRPVGVVSLSGVLDLTRAASMAGSSEPVTSYAGGGPQDVPQHYAVSDPTLLVPAACPVWAVHAEADQVVPGVQATSYVAHALAAGGHAEEVTVPGDHFTLIDPRAPSWPTIRKLLDRARS
jgi:acetyl esterase/lipase